MSQTNNSCAACLRMQQRICDGVNGVPCTLRCQFGLNESAVGVIIGREIVAYLQTGQVFFKAPKPAQTNRVLNQIKALGLNVNRRDAEQQYNETPVVQPGEYHATIRLLQFFADQLGVLANQILLQQKNSEPVQITRARQYIEANSHEDLSLAIVAKQAGMSPFYFCKMFRKVTGVHFARYVSCVRVEQAKNLLLNPNYRVSEIAFEIGFQSLTHFNRIFKNIAGQSPTEYRRHLSTKLNARS
jgi:AraC-like DNA-binding protein